MKNFIRNFNKQKVIGILNILGLSLGIMTSVLIGIWAINEFSFDSFHTNKDCIYRICSDMTYNNEPITFSGSYRPFGKEAKFRYPEIEEFCYVLTNQELIAVNNQMNKEDRISIVDDNFFSIFSFPLKIGNPKTVLSAPDNVLIDEKTAMKYFDQQDPIGRVVKYEGREYKVSGVMYDMPRNSHIQANIIFPFASSSSETDRWGMPNPSMVHLLLNKDTDINQLSKKLTTVTTDYMPSMIDLGFSTRLEPLKDIHFGKALEYSSAIKGNKSLVSIFMLTALVILIISCVNFENLFISNNKN